MHYLIRHILTPHWIQCDLKQQSYKHLIRRRSSFESDKLAYSKLHRLDIWFESGEWLIYAFGFNLKQKEQKKTETKELTNKIKVMKNTEM